MKFDCKSISITNNEFGCTIELADKIEEPKLEMTYDEIIDSLGEYVLLQRTFAEDEFDSDYRYFETGDMDINGELINFKIKLTMTEFLMKINGKKIEVSIAPEITVYNDLKDALRTIAYNQGELTIQE
jgi:hypothetical protein